MVWYVILPNVDNVITRVRYAFVSSIIILLSVKKIETSVGTWSVSIADQSLDMGIGAPYLATSAYVSMAFMPLLFFSAIGIITFLRLSRSPTFSNANCKNILR